LATTLYLVGVALASRRANWKVLLGYPLEETGVEHEVPSAPSITAITAEATTPSAAG
jgi:hypothetical protein